jgi:ribosomal subunit interface protein
MDIPLQITFHGMAPSPAVEARVRERAERLERFAEHINSCRVVVEAPHHRRTKGKHYEVRIDINVPGKELVVSRKPGDVNAHEDVYVAIRDAFDAARRQLEDHVRAVKGQVKTHDVPAHGKVLRLFPAEGYGFVLMPDGQEIYFHRNAVVEQGFDALEVGAEVRVAVVEGESADGPQATTVRAVGKHHVAGRPEKDQGTA